MTSREQGHRGDVTPFPLGGVTVLDVAADLPGSLCARFLADWGADVLKVEHPGSGDRCRRCGPFPGDLPLPEQGGLFLYLNASKLGVTLDLGCETGRRIFLRLVEEAHVVVENPSPESGQGSGLEYQALARVNPGLIMTSIAGFGLTGPYRAYRSGNLVALALGGWIYRQGEAAREPVQSGGSLALYAAGLMAAVGTATAVYQWSRTGEGQHLEVSLQEAVVNALVFPTVHYSVTGQDLPRRGNAAPGVFSCQDGYIGANLLTHQHWESFFYWLGREDLLKDPRFADGQERQAHRRELTAELAPWFANQRKTDLFAAAQELRLPFGLVSTMEDLFANEHLRARRFFQQVPHPGLGMVAVPGPPFRMAGSPGMVRRSAPALGQHNEQVYRGRLGLTRGDLARLSRYGVV